MPAFHPRLLVVVPFLVPAVPLAAQQSFSLAGERVAIYNLAGTVTLTGGSGGAVQVRATPGGADAGRLRFESGEVRGRAAFRVIYPADEIAYRGPDGADGQTRVRVNDDGTFAGDGWGKKGRSVSVGARGGLDAHADLAVSVPAGRTVEVFLAVGAVTATNVNGALRLDVSAASVKVAGHKGDISVDAGSGDVDVSRSEGALSVDVGSGNVRLTDVVATAGFSLDAGSGNLSGNNVRVRNLNVDVGSGNVELTGLQANDLDVDSGSGDVRLDLAADPGNVSIETGSGDVELRLPASAGAQVDVETGTGDIRSDFALQVTHRGQEGLSGTLGDGRGRLAIETGSGDVSLLKR